MTCYLSIQNDQGIVGVPGTIYTFDSGGQVACSIWGTFFGVTDDQMGVGLHRTSYQANGSPTNCVLIPTCPAGQTPVCGNSSFSTGVACQGAWIHDLYLGVVNNRTKSLSCFGVGQPIWASQIGTCD